MICVSLFSMLQGVAFDLDGTLLDTMPVWAAAIREVVEKHGIVCDDVLFRELMNAKIPDVIARLKEELQLEASVDEILAPLTPTYQRLATTMTIPKKPGADALLDALVASGIPFSLATSSPREVLDHVLATVGWQNRFAVIVTGDEMVNDKPAPDIFEEAARRLGCDVERCVAFEDTPKGITSAKTAGMKVVGMFDPRFALDLDAADHRIESFDQISIDDLRKFF